MSDDKKMMYYGFESTIKAIYNRLIFLKNQGLLPDWLEVHEEEWRIINKKSNEIYQLKIKNLDLPQEGKARKLVVLYSLNNDMNVTMNYKDWIDVIQRLVSTLNLVTDYLADKLNQGEAVIQVDKQVVDVINTAYVYHINKDIPRITTLIKNNFTTVDEALEFIKNEKYSGDTTYYHLDRAVLGLVVDFVDKKSGFELKSKEALIHILTTLLWANSSLWDKLE